MSAVAAHAERWPRADDDDDSEGGKLGFREKSSPAHFGSQQRERAFAGGGQRSLDSPPLLTHSPAHDTDFRRGGRELALPLAQGGKWRKNFSSAVVESTT